MKNNIINLTPHTVILCGKEYPSQGLARVDSTTTQVGEVNGIPVNKVIFGEISGLPAPKEGTIYIVSRIVADAAKPLGRNDLFIPDKTVRDDQGRITGCNALAVV